MARTLRIVRVPTFNHQAPQRYLTVVNCSHLFVVTISVEADESGAGPASLMAIDPDGNTILIDQHLESPPSE